MKTRRSIPGETLDAFLALCEGIGTPRALQAAMLARHGDYTALADMETRPKDYVNGWDYRNDVIVTSFFRKTEDLDTNHDRKAVALENFWKSERKCLSTNLRLAPFLENTFEDNTEGIRLEGVHRFFADVRKVVSDILGPLPEFKAVRPIFPAVSREAIRLGGETILGADPYGEARDNLIGGRFGPGATFADRGRYTTLPDKMSENPTLTSDALPYLFQWAGTAWASACASAPSRRDPTFVPGNRFTTVPKDCRKDRGIAVEPSINLFYQLGYGQYLKGRLKRFGIDLKEGQDIHGQVAREASIWGHFATLDLSNASDTVCKNLVKLLLPGEWFEALNMLRSPMTQIVKSDKPSWARCEGPANVRLEKFSSMGNGFTFELETLIFLSICMVAVRQNHYMDAVPGVNVFVYGDDIIVPTGSAKDVISALRYCGFDLNEEKSFVDGPFRESCGSDFWKGLDVRPFFLKELPYEPQHYIALANGLRHLGCNDSDGDIDDRRMLRAWFRVLDAIPSYIRRCRGPRYLGDLLIHDSKEKWEWKRKWQIKYFRVYRPVEGRKVHMQNFRDEVVLASALYVIGPENPILSQGGVLPRDSVSGHKVGWSRAP